jgi:hypothetical protein
VRTPSQVGDGPGARQRFRPAVESA